MTLVGSVLTTSLLTRMQNFVLCCCISCSLYTLSLPRMPEIQHPGTSSSQGGSTDSKHPILRMRVAVYHTLCPPATVSSSMRTIAPLSNTRSLSRKAMCKAALVHSTCYLYNVNLPHDGWTARDVVKVPPTLLKNERFAHVISFYQAFLSLNFSPPAYIRRGGRGRPRTEAKRSSLGKVLVQTSN